MPDSFIFLETGRCLYVGSRFDAVAQKLHPIKICVSLDEPFDVRAGGTQLYRTWGAVVDSSTEHRVVLRGRRMALLLLGAYSRGGIAAQTRLGGRGAMRLPADLAEEARARLIALGENPAPKRAREDFDRILESLAAGRRLRRFDSRIVRTLERLTRNYRRKVPLREFAASVHLSESRLGHLFTRDVGIPLRSYRHWMRLSSAVAHIYRGESLAAAAHDAGFADQAHFCRACLRAFGVPPTQMPAVDAFFDTVDATPSWGLRGPYPLPS